MFNLHFFGVINQLLPVHRIAAAAAAAGPRRRRRRRRRQGLTNDGKAAPAALQTFTNDGKRSKILFC